jgi:hypothetical protein
LPKEQIRAAVPGDGDFYRLQRLPHLGRQRQRQLGHGTDRRITAELERGATVIFQPLTGGVDFGTKNIGFGYNDDATCEFKDLKIRDPGILPRESLMRGPA